MPVVVVTRPAGPRSLRPRLDTAHVCGTHTREPAQWPNVLRNQPNLAGNKIPMIDRMVYILSKFFCFLIIFTFFYQIYSINGIDLMYIA